MAKFQRQPWVRPPSKINYLVKRAAAEPTQAFPRREAARLGVQTPGATEGSNEVHVPGQMDWPVLHAILTHDVPSKAERSQRQDLRRAGPDVRPRRICRPQGFPTVR